APPPQPDSALGRAATPVEDRMLRRLRPVFERGQGGSGLRNRLARAVGRLRHFRPGTIRFPEVRAQAAQRRDDGRGLLRELVEPRRQVADLSQLLAESLDVRL